MIFALSRTGFPLDIRLWPFVPDVSKKIHTCCVLDAFTGLRTISTVPEGLNVYSRH